MEVRVAVIAIAIVAVANFPVTVGAPGWWDDLLGTDTGNGKVNPDAGPKDFVDDQIGQLTTTVLKNSGVGRTLYQSLDDLAAFGDAMELSLNKVFSFVENAGNALLGECDAPELIKLIRPKLKLNLIPITECLGGFKVDLSVISPTMFPGYLNYNETNFNINGFSGDGVQDDSKEIYISFEFTDLEFVYDFKSGYLKMKKNGQLVFKLAGTSKVMLRVRVPSLLEQLKALAEKDTCFVDVRQVYVELPGKLEVPDIQYDSLVENNTKKGVTEYSIKKMANNPNFSGKIKNIVKTTLKKMMEPVINDGTIFCDRRQLTAAEDPRCEAKDIIDLNKNNAPAQ